MSAHAQTFDPREMHPDSLRGSFYGSLTMHVLLLGGAAFYAWWGGPSESFGDPNAGGNVVGVQAVDKIPLLTRGPENPLANDTKSILPQTPPPPKPTPTKAEPKPPEDAVPLKTEQKLKEASPAPTGSKYRPFKDLAPNQLTSNTPQATSSPMFAVPGSGNIGEGSNSTLGTRFGAYGELVRQKVARSWRTSEVAASTKSAPTVIAVFEIQRNGTVSGFRLLQKSGIPALDISVERAIRDSSPFPPLPPAYERDTATVEFWFELKR